MLIHGATWSSPDLQACTSTAAYLGPSYSGCSNAPCWLPVLKLFLIHITCFSRVPLWASWLGLEELPASSVLCWSQPSDRTSYIFVLIQDDKLDSWFHQRLYGPYLSLDFDQTIIIYSNRFPNATYLMKEFVSSFPSDKFLLEENSWTSLK